MERAFRAEWLVDKRNRGRLRSVHFPSHILGNHVACRAGVARSCGYAFHLVCLALDHSWAVVIAPISSVRRDRAGLPEDSGRLRRSRRPIRATVCDRARDRTGHLSSCWPSCPTIKFPPLTATISHTRERDCPRLASLFRRPERRPFAPTSTRGTTRHQKPASIEHRRQAQARRRNKNAQRRREEAFADRRLLGRTVADDEVDGVDRLPCVVVPVIRFRRRGCPGARACTAFCIAIAGDAASPSALPRRGRIGERSERNRDAKNGTGARLRGSSTRIGGSGARAARRRRKRRARSPRMNSGSARILPMIPFVPSTIAARGDELPYVRVNDPAGRGSPRVRLSRR